MSDEQELISISDYGIKIGGNDEPSKGIFESLRDVFSPSSTQPNASEIKEKVKQKIDAVEQSPQFESFKQKAADSKTAVGEKFNQLKQSSQFKALQEQASDSKAAVGEKFNQLKQSSQFKALQEQAAKSKAALGEKFNQVNQSSQALQKQASESKKALEQKIGEYDLNVPSLDTDMYKDEAIKKAEQIAQELEKIASNEKLEKYKNKLDFQVTDLKNKITKYKEDGSKKSLEELNKLSDKLNSETDRLRRYISSHKPSEKEIKEHVNKIINNLNKTKENLMNNLKKKSDELKEKYTREDLEAFKKQVLDESKQRLNKLNEVIQKIKNQGVDYKNNPDLNKVVDEIENYAGKFKRSIDNLERSVSRDINVIKNDLEQFFNSIEINVKDVINQDYAEQLRKYVNSKYNGSNLSGGEIKSIEENLLEIKKTNGVTKASFKDSSFTNNPEKMSKLFNQLGGEINNMLNESNNSVHKRKAESALIQITDAIGQRALKLNNNNYVMSGGYNKFMKNTMDKLLSNNVKSAKQLSDDSLKELRVNKDLNKGFKDNELEGGKKGPKKGSKKGGSKRKGDPKKTGGAKKTSKGGAKRGSKLKKKSKK
jgi:hypothetical protein